MRLLRKSWVNRTLPFTRLPEEHGRGLECLDVISFHAEQEALQLIASFKTIVRMEVNSYLPNSELVNNFSQEVGIVSVWLVPALGRSGIVERRVTCMGAQMWAHTRGLGLMRLAEGLGPKRSLSSAHTYCVFRKWRSSHEGQCDGSASGQKPCLLFQRTRSQNHLELQCQMHPTLSSGLKGHCTHVMYKHTCRQSIHMKYSGISVSHSGKWL